MQICLRVTKCEGTPSQSFTEVGAHNVHRQYPQLSFSDISVFWSLYTFG